MRTRTSLPLLLLLIALLFLVDMRASAQAPAVSNSLTVMTRNVYFGTDPTQVLLSGCDEFAAMAAAAYQEALQSDYATRAAALAAEIRQTMPDFVGIQEAVLWDEMWEGGQAVDFVQLIRDDLAASGVPYTPVAVAAGVDITFPTTLAGDVRLRVNDVLLVREGAALSLGNVQTGNYQNRLVIPTCIGLVPLPRQWVAVDVALGGATVRVITTHLESVLASVRRAQAGELLDGPGTSELPTIIMGDLNAEPDTADDAAALILAAGYSDTWTGAAGAYTCCQAKDLRNETSLLDKRIDLVLVRTDLQSTAAAIVGDSPLSPLPASGVRWASDHAGTVVTLQLSAEPAIRLFLPAIRRSLAGER